MCRYGGKPGPVEGGSPCPSLWTAGPHLESCLDLTSALGFWPSPKTCGQEAPEYPWGPHNGKEQGYANSCLVQGEHKNQACLDTGIEI